MDLKMKRGGAALLALLALTLGGAAPADAQSSSSQAVLEVLKRLESLEGRLGSLEGRVGRTAPTPAPQSREPVLATLDTLRSQVTSLEGAVQSAREETSRVSELDARVDALSQELSAVQQGEMERLEALKDELASLVSDLRGLAAEAKAAEAKAAEGPRVKFTGRVHTPFNTTSTDEPITSEFMIRRARLTAEIELNDLVSGKIQPDYWEGKITLKDAYFRLGFSPQFRMTIGQFKRPFDLFELTSSTEILVVERAGSIRGAGSCAGIGGICSLSRFTEKLGYSDRDIGVMVDGRIGSSPWSYMASVTNGAGANADESNASKSYGFRATYAVNGDLKVAANVALHDYDGVDDVAAQAKAWGLDAEWGSVKRMGWHAQAGFVQGDNWKSLDGAGVPSTFRTAQAILTYKFPVSAGGVSAVEPLVRVSVGDPDDAVLADREWFTTAGLMLHFVGKNRIAFNVDSWTPYEGKREWSLKAQTFLHW